MASVRLMMAPFGVPRKSGVMAMAIPTRVTTMLILPRVSKDFFGVPPTMASIIISTGF